MMPSSWPNASNTGVPAGTALKASGSITVSTAGTVISGLDINGCVDVKASNVVIKNSRITCGRTTPAVRVYSGVTNLLVEDSEIDGAGTSPACIGYGEYTLFRSNLHDCVDGVEVGRDTAIEYSYVHDLSRGSGTHDDAIQTLGGVNILIVGNTLQAYRADTDDPMNASIQTGHLNENLTNALVAYNYMDGGNYTVNAGADSTNGYKISGYVFTGNRFGRDFRYGPVSELGTGITFDSSNVWADTGARVN